MAAAIKNLTDMPIYVALNSGTGLRLSPGEVASDIHDVELKDNAKVEKLLQRQAISVEHEDEAPADKRDAADEPEEAGAKKKSRAGRS